MPSAPGGPPKLEPRSVIRNRKLVVKPAAHNCFCAYHTAPDCSAAAGVSRMKLVNRAALPTKFRPVVETKFEYVEQFEDVLTDWTVSSALELMTEPKALVTRTE